MLNNGFMGMAGTYDLAFLLYIFVRFADRSSIEVLRISPSSFVRISFSAPFRFPIRFFQPSSSIFSFFSFSPLFVRLNNIKNLDYPLNAV